MTQGFPSFGAPPQTPQFQQPPQQAAFFTQQDPAFQAQQQYAPVAPVAPEQPTDTSGFFGGGASISWDDRKGYVKGTPRGGQIIDKKITNQTKMGTNEILRWDNGDVRKQMELTLQTAERADPQDDGKRRLFIKGDLPRAAREAMKAVGATDLVIGGWFYAAWVSEKKSTKPGFHDQKVFNAVYAPPGSPDPMAGQPAYVAPTPAQPAQGGFPGNGPMGVMAPAPAPTPPGVPADQAAAFAAWQAQQQGAQPPNGAGPAPVPAQPETPAPAPQGTGYNPFA